MTLSVAKDCLERDVRCNLSRDLCVLRSVRFPDLADTPFDAGRSELTRLSQ
jgi:hypothetical protein